MKWCAEDVEMSFGRYINDIEKKIKNRKATIYEKYYFRCYQLIMKFNMVDWNKDYIIWFIKNCYKYSTFED